MGFGRNANKFQTEQWNLTIFWIRIGNLWLGTMLAYRPPSLDALICRRSFYSSSRLPTESTADWFGRIAKTVSGCGFENFADIMLIDKFLSGIDEAVYSQILNEFTLDSKKALIIALANSGENEDGIFMKVEVEDEYQVKVWKLFKLKNRIQQNQFQEFESSWIDNDDGGFTPEGKADLPEEKILEKVDDKKFQVNPKNPKKTRKSKATTKRQKRDDFIINDQNRIVCLRCSKSYATRKSFRRHYMMYV